MIIDVQAIDCSATHCKPIAQQSTLIVRARARQGTTLPSLANPSTYVNHSRSAGFFNLVTLHLPREKPSMVLCFAAPGQFPFDFQLEGQTEKRADEHNQSEDEHVLNGRCDD